MAQCRYCGQSAGFNKKMHPECHERHERAIVQIPEFFPKFFLSDLSIDRFGELLRSAAQASFVRPDEFTELAALGLSKVLARVLEERLLTGGDMQKLRDIAQCLAPLLTRDIIPHETFAKIDILQELGDAKVPDLVSVAGPMPIELGRGETVIWIFNYVTCYRDVGAADDVPADSERGPAPLSVAAGAYYGPSAFDAATLPRARLRQQGSGDLVVTNHNLFFVNSNANARRFPVAKMAALRAYSDGVHIACEPVADRTRVFSLGDSWFAANLLVRLVQMGRRRLGVPPTE